MNTPIQFNRKDITELRSAHHEYVAFPYQHSPAAYLVVDFEGDAFFAFLDIAGEEGFVPVDIEQDAARELLKEYLAVGAPGLHEVATQGYRRALALFE